MEKDERCGTVKASNLGGLDFMKTLDLFFRRDIILLSSKRVL